MMVLQEEVKVCCTLRSGREPRGITVDDWEFYTVEDGFFKGLNAVRLKPKHAGQKNKDLLLVNHTKKETHKKTQHLPILQTGKLFCV